MVTTDFGAPASTASATTGGRKLRLGALTALVIGSMVGSSVFSLPQNMAAGAGPLAILIGWAITAVGMLALDTPAARPIRRANPAALASDSFPAGSMGPKIAAATGFAVGTERPAAIGQLGDALAILRGERGTWIDTSAPPAESLEHAQVSNVDSPDECFRCG